MNIKELREGDIVEYKRDGTTGWYEARVVGFASGKVVLRVLRYWTDQERHEPGWRACVKPSRILKVRERTP